MAMDHPPIVAELVKTLPLKPGVYRFFDTTGRLLYIGKATNLRSRVQSYFRASTDLSASKRFMVAQIVDIQFTVVDTPEEALLLETTLIKKYKPPYNVVMKDDKNFQYIHITADPYPRLETIRKIKRSEGGRYFGPYTSGRAIQQTLRLLKAIFHYCESAPILKKGSIQFPKRPCLDFHLGKCVGPCANVISEEEYKKIFNHIAQFLKGDYEPIYRSVQKQMQRASEKRAYEKAAHLRDQLSAIEQMMMEQKVVSASGENADYLSLARIEGHAAVNLFVVRKGKMIHQDVFVLQHTKDQSDEEIMHAFADQYYSLTETRPTKVVMSTQVRRGKNRKLIEMGTMNAEQALEKYRIAREKRERSAEQGLAELAKALGMKRAQLARVEIYDISNVQGTYSVGSMVVFIDGLPAPGQYRKFKIKTVEGPNDFASLREVMDRRLQHLPGKSRGRDETQAWPRPDLIIIDGGKGQLSAAKTIIDILKLDIPIVSLAKREEELFVPGREESVRLPEGSPGYHLVQRMRDEAHRFAIGFYRSRHLKGLVE